MSCAIGRPFCSGGMYSLYMPSLMMLHEAPPSVLAQTPAVETPTRMSSGLRGSISTELMPGCSPPATPCHCRRSGINHSGSFNSQDSPPFVGAEEPARHRPGPQPPGDTPPGSMTQILPTDQGCGSSAASSGFGGNAGA